ncbi:WD repeat-containing protein 47-like [Diadema antillarum]|uniref:WD repeat-containing protein 47-like n=1 Tax=Diadema antillarum TaxID=105358 RepID=UPI003A8469BA
MPAPVNVTVKESEVVKLVLDFLHSRELYLSMRSLERESGIVNGLFSDDALFLRQLILDGQWDDALEFIQPLESIESFDSKTFHYIILKHKFLEMLCMKSEDFQHLQMEFSSEEVVNCLSELEPYCPAKEDYSSFCLLLTLPRLTDHQMYKDWSPSSARVQCFQSVYPLVSRFLPVDKSLAENESTASKDRLVQLVLKGLLFENCVEFCQQKAINRDAKNSQIVLRSMMTGTPADDADLSLLSWLQSLPHDTFATPFEQRTLQVSMNKIIKPSTSFSEQIMTPMTPTPGSKTRMYPSPSPSTPTLYRGRPFSATSRALSQSLTPNLESLLNQAKKKDDNGTTDPGVLSRSLMEFKLSGNNSARESLPTLTEDVEKPTVPPFSISNPTPSQAAQGRANTNTQGKMAKIPVDVRNSSAAAYDEFRHDRERAQRELQEREQRRQQLEQELMGGGGGSGGGNVGMSGSQGNGMRTTSPAHSSTASIIGQAPRQVTPPNFILRPTSSVNSSTPKVPYSQMNHTPEPEASPILSNPRVPLHHQGLQHQQQQQSQHGRYQSRASQRTASSSSGSPSPLTPTRQLETSFGEVLGPGGNLKNVTYTKVPPPTAEVPRPIHPAASHSQHSPQHHKQHDVSRELSQQYYLSKQQQPHPPQPQQQPQYPLPPHHHQQHHQQHHHQQQQPIKFGMGDASLTVAGHPVRNNSPAEVAGGRPSPQQSPRQSPRQLPCENNLAIKPRAKGGITIWKPTCHAITSLEDVQAIRAVTFDPTGNFYAVGSNSKTLRICVYPGANASSGGSVQQPKVLFKRMRHHKGSIYCVAWSHSGNLVATGSNDKLIKLVRFDPDKCNASGPDVDLSFHDGTVRDLVFQDSPCGTTLISAGAGDCSICLTDCQQGQAMHAMAGHTGHVLSLYAWSGNMLASGSQDNTVRLWDVRTPRCVQIIGSPGSDNGEGSGAAAVAVDPSGRLLASGHEDASCMLYDIHGGRPLQTYKSHSSDIRSLRFSPSNFYLMSGSYDCTIKLANLQGDITQPIPTSTIAEHRDKVIQCRWHPSDLSFLTSSADRTVTLWTMDNP